MFLNVKNIRMIFSKDYNAPPWLSWQSVRLLTDRSSVRSRVGAFFLFVKSNYLNVHKDNVWLPMFNQRVHSSVVEHGIADPAVTGSNPVVPSSWLV